MQKTAMYWKGAMWPQKQGLERWMGPTQAAIMDYLWEQSTPSTIPDIHDHLRRVYRADLAYTTVGATLARLVQDGLVIKAHHLDSKAHLYVAPESRAVYEERRVRKVLASIQATHPTLLDEVTVDWIDV